MHFGATGSEYLKRRRTLGWGAVCVCGGGGGGGSLRKKQVTY